MGVVATFVVAGGILALTNALVAAAPPVRGVLATPPPAVPLVPPVREPQRPLTPTP
jgi:hypothetical protein